MSDDARVFVPCNDMRSLRGERHEMRLRFFVYGACFHLTTAVVRGHTTSLSMVPLSDNDGPHLTTIACLEVDLGNGVLVKDALFPLDHLLVENGVGGRKSISPLDSSSSHGVALESSRAAVLFVLTIWLALLLLLLHFADLISEMRTDSLGLFFRVPACLDFFGCVVFV
jgi:hypothetical protein